MTLDQALAVGLITATIGMFVWGRLPYDLVALTALLLGIALRIVPEKHAFDGFSDEIVVIIAAALVVSAGIVRSGVIEALMRPIPPRLRTQNGPHSSRQTTSRPEIAGGMASARPRRSERAADQRSGLKTMR